MDGDRSGGRNDVAGDARIGVSIQVGGDVHGGVHVHHPDRLSISALHQARVASRNYTNQRRVIAAADQAIAQAGTGGPHILVFRGSPGIGKREAGRHWLDHHRAEYPDGQFYADLSGSMDLGGLESSKLREFLLAAGHDPAVIPESLEGRAAWFRSWTTGKRVAVVLDRVLAPSQVRMLLPGSGPSVVIVTEAGSLHALSADSPVTFLDLSPLEPAAAEELLGRLIGEQRVSAEPAAAQTLLRICAGLPIALCVLGPMLTAFPGRPLSRFADQLADDERRLKTLSGNEDLSVTVVFDNAYLRLGDLAQRSYRVLGLHPGDLAAGLQALAAMLELPEQDARDGVDQLLLAQLLREAAPDRYVLDEWPRRHARQICGGPEFAAERQAVPERILAFYEEWLTVAAVAVLPGRSWQQQFFPEYVADAGMQLPVDPWVWLETERENLRACAELAHRRGEFRRVCHLAVMLWPLHDRGKYYEDHIAVNAMGLEAAHQLGDSALAALIGVQLGFPYLNRGEPDQAAGIFSTALDAARAAALEDRRLEATALEALGLARIAQGRPADAVVLLRQNLDLALELGAPRRIALAQFHLAKAESGEAAVQLLGDALDAFTALEPPDAYNAAQARLWLGRKLTGLGRLGEAADSLHGALKAVTVQGKPFDRVQALEALGDLARAQGDGSGATTNYQEALALAESYRFTAEVKRIRAKAGAQ